MGNFIDSTSADKVNAESYEFGHIFYRFRIPKLADEGLELVQQKPRLVIEQASTAPTDLRGWIDSQIQSLRGLNANATYN
jgi:hypothetical protein